ncbi:MAG TPA: SPOR domain-containing protein [Limnochordia bacterium]
MGTGERTKKMRRVKEADQGWIEILRTYATIVIVAVVAALVGYQIGLVAIRRLTAPLTTAQPAESSPPAARETTGSTEGAASRDASASTAAPAAQERTVATEPEDAAPAEEPASAKPVVYRVHVGPFATQASADAALARLRQAGFVDSFRRSGPPYYVQAGAFTSEEGAARVAAALRAEGFTVSVSP